MKRMRNPQNSKEGKTKQNKLDHILPIQED